MGQTTSTHETGLELRREASRAVVVWKRFIEHLKGWCSEMSISQRMKRGIYRCHRDPQRGSGIICKFWKASWGQRSLVRAFKGQWGALDARWELVGDAARDIDKGQIMEAGSVVLGTWNLVRRYCAAIGGLNQSTDVVRCPTTLGNSQTEANRQIYLANSHCPCSSL